MLFTSLINRTKSALKIVFFFLLTWNPNFKPSHNRIIYSNEDTINCYYHKRLLLHDSVNHLKSLLLRMRFMWAIILFLFVVTAQGLRILVPNCLPASINNITLWLWKTSWFSLTIGQKTDPFVFYPGLCCKGIKCMRFFFAF